MGGLPLWAITLAGIVVVLWVVYTQTGRALAVTVLVLVALVGLKRAVVREAGFCEPTGAPCRLDLDHPHWSGPCFSSSGGAIESEAGRYFLLAPLGAPAYATCLDIRIFR